MTASSKPTLSRPQLDKLADIFVGLTHVALGLSVVPSILQPELASIALVGTGLLLSLASAVTSLLLAKSL